jgi:hypothetical protein
VHWLAPAAAVNVPTAQAVQVEPLAADHELRNVPDTHATQVLCPVLDWNVPSGQPKQDCMPSAD